MASLTNLWVGWWRQQCSSGRPAGVWLRVCYGESEEKAREQLERYVKLPGTRVVLVEGEEPYGKKS